MIFYCFVFSLLFFVLVGLSLRIDAGIFFVQIYFWVFGFFGILSVIYLELGQVYIIEQFRVSHFNGAAIVLLLLFFSHLAGGGGVLLALRNRLRLLVRIRKETVPCDDVWIMAFWVASVSLIFLLYLNLFLSDLPPLLREGYVDRFIYVESTNLWWLLGPFGMVTVPVPIFLGWLLHVSKKKNLILFMVALYILYLALIGQKFGGFVLAVFLVFLPAASSRMVGYDMYRWLSRVLIYGGGGGVVVLGVVYYHYSNYVLSEEFGGPLGLIFYRIFGLQGHAFWGGFNYFLNSPFGEFEVLGLIDGMQNVMRLISPSIAGDMIERGVGFTFGYFISLLLHLGLLAFPFAFFMGAVHAILAYAVVCSVINFRPVIYFAFANILVSFNSLISMGSFSYVFNYKVFALVVLLLFAWPLSSVRVFRWRKAVQ